MGLSVRLVQRRGPRWLATLADDEALAVVGRQASKAAGLWTDAPTTAKALLTYLRSARKRGFSMIIGCLPGMSAMAAVVQKRDGEVIGVITIAGPLIRLTESA
jgi:DNA-binding IclR family transcriptional regulator